MPERRVDVDDERDKPLTVKRSETWGIKLSGRSESHELHTPDRGTLIDEIASSVDCSSTTDETGSASKRGGCVGVGEGVTVEVRVEVGVAVGVLLWSELGVDFGSVVGIVGGGGG